MLSGRLFLSPLLSVLLSPPNSSLCSLSPVLSPLFYVLSPPLSSLLCSLPSMFSDLLLSCIFSLLNVLLSPLFYVLLSPPPLSSWLLLSVCFPLGAGGEPGGRDPLLTTRCSSVLIYHASQRALKYFSQTQWLWRHQNGLVFCRQFGTCLIKLLVLMTWRRRDPYLYWAVYCWTWARTWCETMHIVPHTMFSHCMYWLLH